MPDSGGCHGLGETKPAPARGAVARQPTRPVRCAVSSGAGKRLIHFTRASDPQGRRWWDEVLESSCWICCRLRETVRVDHMSWGADRCGRRERGDRIFIGRASGLRPAPGTRHVCQPRRGAAGRALGPDEIPHSAVRANGGEKTGADLLQRQGTVSGRRPGAAPITPGLELRRRGGSEGRRRAVSGWRGRGDSAMAAGLWGGGRGLRGRDRRRPCRLPASTSRPGMSDERGGRLAEVLLTAFLQHLSC